MQVCMQVILVICLFCCLCALALLVSYTCSFTHTRTWIQQQKVMFKCRCNCCFSCFYSPFSSYKVNYLSFLHLISLSLFFFKQLFYICTCVFSNSLLFCFNEFHFVCLKEASNDFCMYVFLFLHTFCVIVSLFLHKITTTQVAHSELFQYFYAGCDGVSEQTLNVALSAAIQQRESR